MGGIEARVETQLKTRARRHGEPGIEMREAAWEEARLQIRLPWKLWRGRSRRR